MAINEIFANPTVKSVFFEVRFPNLFYLEQKIGDLQLKLLAKFPESALAYRRQFVFADVAPDAVPPTMKPDSEEGATQKVWQFKSPNQYTLSVQTSSFVIASEYHKTYNLGEGDRFRDIISFVVDAFLSLTNLPMLNRIGLRYLDECPVIERTNKSFLSYYNTSLPIERFPLPDAQHLELVAITKRGDSMLRYAERLITNPDGAPTLMMDFDGSREKVPTPDYLQVTDQLHELISTEYQHSIKEPLIQRMRTPKGAAE